jgi:hypothetical protein
MKRTVAISLKIPDNAAYTALVALRKLGVAVERADRSEIRIFDDDGEAGALAARIKADETIFNPNKHRLTMLDDSGPRPGEVWIEPLASERTAPERPGAIHATAWRLFEKAGAPAKRETLESAADRLLCNPAIERAVY